jgi:hypothetical protein
LPYVTGPNGEVNIGGADEGKYVNSAGDVVGVASTPPGVRNPGFGVLWKRKPDGSYRVHTVESLLQQTNRVFVDDVPTVHGLAEDGSILLRGLRNLQTNVRDAALL